jgi:transcriptional regulator
MYIPASFAQPEIGKLHEFMRQNSFATLTSSGEHGLITSHLPLLFDAALRPNGQLRGHMARANPHRRDVRGEVLAVFSGPHVYVSPAWYEERGTVSTWNYVAVHAHGTFHLTENRDELLETLRLSVNKYEGRRPKRWVLDESDEAIMRMLGAIVGFRVEITRLEGKWKLSQNHSSERRRKVIQALRDHPDEDSRAIVALMEEALR